MQAVNWGQVIPEAVNTDRNEFVYVYNHDLSSQDKIDRTIRFILGRLSYYDTKLPQDPKHLIKIDARGQQLSDSICEQIKLELLARYSEPNCLIVDIIK